MPGFGVPILNQSMTLQSTLSSTSSGVGPEVHPHHPVTCQSKLYYHEDDSLECEHARTGAGDPRTKSCVTHSIALMLINMAVEGEFKVTPWWEDEPLHVSGRL